MKTIPTTLDHDIALRLCQSAPLSDQERVTCSLIALAAMVGEPVQPDTMAAFNTLVRERASA